MPSPRSLLIVFLTVSVATAGSLLPLDDAGTGTDAGDTPENATPLPGPGNYTGMLWPPGDADWYELPFDNGRAACYAAEIGGNVVGTGVLTPTAELDPAVDRPLEPGKVLDLGLSVPGAGSILLGLEPSRSTPGDVSVGSYEFELRVHQTEKPGHGPAERSPGAEGGQDAGPTWAASAQIDGPCLNGTLDGDGDRVDTYVFDATADDRVALSLAQAALGPAQLELISPDGEQLALLEDGGFEDIRVDKTGEYTLVAELRGGSPSLQLGYVAGLTINGPERPPCYPGCFVSSG